MYQQQKRYNTAIDRFSDFKLGMVSQLKREKTGGRGSGGLKLQYIRNGCHIF